MLMQKMRMKKCLCIYNAKITMMKLFWYYYLMKFSKTWYYYLYYYLYARIYKEDRRSSVFLPILWCCKGGLWWVGSPDGGSDKGGSPRASPTKHTSMGTSTSAKISSLSFLHYFLLVFLNFPDLSPSSLCFWIFLICPIKKLFHGNMGT